jgi:RNA polymerase sigma-70 factor (ECF subfamily)
LYWPPSVATVRRSACCCRGTGRALVRLCLRLTSESATAEDCAKDACLLAYLRLDRLRSPESFGAWLNGIGRHTCYHAVQAQRQGSTSLTDVLELPPSEMGSPVVAVTQSELSRDLRTAVGGLPAAQREAVRVFYLDRLSQSEAAATLGISLSALKVRLHDARRTLKYRYRLDDAARALSRRNPRTLAFHEAGHAVLLWSHAAPIQSVSIEPRSAVWVGEPGETGTQFRLPVTIQLQMLMAGEAATFVQGRWSPSLEQSGDALLPPRWLVKLPGMTRGKPRCSFIRHGYKRASSSTASARGDVLNVLPRHY